jgi:uncharacterized protein YlxW (UPF0749 family)
MFNKMTPILIFCVICASLVTGDLTERVKRADDVNTELQALRTLVQQLAAAMTAVQAKVTTLENKVTALSHTGETICLNFPFNI